ncbi:hypothetical protein LTR65_007734 [Meristemomyces frigidus]
MPMREDFTKPVSLVQLHAHGLIDSLAPGTPPTKPTLVGWCQVVAGFFTQGHQLYGPKKQLVYMRSKTVYWSDAAPATDDSEYRSVELLFFARTYHKIIAPLVKGMEVRHANWVLLEHTINAIVIHRTGNVARRLAIVDIHDMELWESVPKEWMLIKLM